MKILYFTDAHVEPDTNLDRFLALGNAIVNIKPDMVVQGGDFSSMLSLSGWDKDKRKIMEGRRYKKDIDCSVRAIKLMLFPLGIYNDRKGRNKEKQYRPHFVWMDGNHEYWVEKYIEQHPEVDGFFNLKKELQPHLPKGTAFVPYKDGDNPTWFSVGGVVFTHAVRNRAGTLSSKYLADRALSEVFNCNVVFGHTHRLQTSTNMKFDSDGDLRLVRAINGGCFFDEDPAYSAGNINDYWKGVLVLEIDQQKNIFRVVEEIPMNVLKEKYL